MKLQNNLQTKILVKILISVIVLFAFVGVFVGVSNRIVANKNAHDYTNLQAQANAQKLSSVLNQHYGYLQSVKNAMLAWNKQGVDSLDNQLETLIKNQASNQESFTSLWVVFQVNKIHKLNNLSDKWLKLEVNSASQSLNVINSFSDSDERFKALTTSETDYCSAPYIVDENYFIDIAVPLIENGSVLGYAGAALPVSTISNLYASLNLPEGSYLSVFDNTGTYIYNQVPGSQGKSFQDIFPDEAKKWQVRANIGSGKAFDMTTEFMNKIYLSCFEPVYFGNAGKAFAVEVKIPIAILLQEAKLSVMRSVVAAIFAMLVVIIIVWLMSKKIVAPINKVTKALEFLSKGDTNSIQKVDIHTNDELQAMSDSLNKVVDGIRTTESFALEIEKGNFDNEFKLLSDADQLGKALVDMRESLKTNAEEQKKTKQEEELRSWSNHGIARFSEILRQNNDNLKKLGYEVIRNLVDYLKVNQAALFVLNEDDEEEVEAATYECLTTIAYSRNKAFKKTIELGEGLVGQCAYERKTIYITDVPDDYHEITSGLGTANPKCLLIVPCSLDEKVYSVIEIAAFTELEKHEIEFVENIAASVASTIANVRITEKTTRLLNTSQSQSEEMAAQEEELRQNLEEMETTQEDLQRQMKENSAMRENLSKQNALLDALLRSLPDFIYFKDKDCKFIRISDSMLHLFNAQSVDEVIGKSDFDFQIAERAKEYYDEEQDIIRSGEGITNKIIKETLVDGSEEWMSITKLPLLDADGKPFGTFGISKNVTQLKKLEVEANKQREESMKQEALLNALLRSLPDYIYFKDKDSKFIRISDSMLTLFDAQSVNEVIGKSDFDYHKAENAQEFYEEEQKIINTRKGITNKIIKELLIDGSEQWMSITKLPLLDVNGNPMGTFGISKDVTEIKEIEIEAKAQNEELQAQEEELRQNLEEMQTVQEDLKTQMDVNRNIRENLMEEKLLLDALLNSLPDYIYFKDDKSKFLRISKSMLSIFDANDVKEIIGKSDFDFHTKENAQRFYDDEQEIMKKRKGITNQLEKEIKASGEVQWNSITKLPLINDEGKAVGTFGISKDVTEIKQIEQQAIQRENELLKLINAFNSNVFTIEYDTKGNIISANENMLKFFGVKEKDVVGKHHKDGLKMKDVSAKQYNKFWSEVQKGNSLKQQSQIELGNKNIWVSEIYSPVFNQEGSVDRILKIAIDINDLMANIK